MSKKTKGSQRPIVDARISNAFFQPCSYVHLAGGPQLGALELDESAELWIGTADIKDAFYNSKHAQQVEDVD